MYFALYRDSPSWDKLDILLIYLEEVGIKSVEYKRGYFGCTITFNDGTTYSFWNENKWFAWMVSGEITFSNGKKLEWKDRMPSSEVLYKYRRYIRKIKKDPDSDYTEYLPLKLLRKMKLKKLK
jgi:hypothetical protein